MIFLTFIFIFLSHVIVSAALCCFVLIIQINFIMTKMESQLWTKIFDEVDKFSDMDELDIKKKFVTQDELIRGDCIHPLTPFYIHLYKKKCDTWHILML